MATKRGAERIYGIPRASTLALAVARSRTTPPVPSPEVSEVPLSADPGSHGSSSGARSRWPGRVLRVGRWVFTIAVLAALVKVAVDNGEALRDVELDIRWAWLIAALPVGLAAGVVLPLGWRRLVASYGVAISRGHAVRVWVLSQTARYLPTGIAGFAAARGDGREGGRPPHVDERNPRDRARIARRVGGPLRRRVHPLVGCRDTVADPARRRVCDCDRGAARTARARRSPLPALPALAPHLLDRRQMHEATLVYGVNAVLKSTRWVMIAAGVLAVHGSDIPLLIGAEALGVLAGLVGITPAGIGVREAVIAGALRDRFGFADAFALAVIARRVDFVVELIWIGIALVLRRNAAASDAPDRAAPASSLGDT